MEMTFTKRALAIGSVVATALVAVPVAASAAEQGPQARRVSAANFDCPTGDLCAYSGPDGTGSRCVWSGSDDNWLSGSISCSWAGTKPVLSVYNKGTSPDYEGVALYLSPNYVDQAFCAQQGTATDFEGVGVKTRSHQWVTAC
jgi:hypothetical protein